MYGVSNPRQLDLLVAEKVLKQRWRVKAWGKTFAFRVGDGPEYEGEVGKYTCMIHHTWLLVGTLVHGLQDHAAHDFSLHGSPTSGWKASFRCPQGYLYEAEGETAPMAICHASLKACGVYF